MFVEADSTRITDYVEADLTRILYGVNLRMISGQRPLGRKDQRQIRFYPPVFSRAACSVGLYNP